MLKARMNTIIRRITNRVMESRFTRTRTSKVRTSSHTYKMATRTMTIQQVTTMTSSSMTDTLPLRGDPRNFTRRLRVCESPSKRIRDYLLASARCHLTSSCTRRIRKKGPTESDHFTKSILMNRNKSTTTRLRFQTTAAGANKSTTTKTTTSPTWQTRLSSIPRRMPLLCRTLNPLLDVP